MNKIIRTYDDLLSQEKQMEELLQAQKELLMSDLNQLKEELQPATTALTFFSRIITRDKHNLLVNGGIDRVIDLVFRKVLLARAGWLTKLTVPFFIKNYSSHFIADHKGQLVERLFSLFSHKNSNGKAAPEPHTKEN
ncbi:MAG TPA: hypothetical protein VK483_06310 [Chitinophagaceae bacterium]|nr:hypothetical protein [Chitinophagaceae bacterium]